MQLELSAPVKHRLRASPRSLLAPGTKGSNAADYTPRHFDRPFVYCGWMDPHDDKNNGIDEYGRDWSFRAYYWDPEAVFIHTLPSRGGRAIVEPTPEVVSFRADLKHAFVPRSMAERLLRNWRTDGLGLDFSKPVRPKLIWRWVHLVTGREYVWGEPWQLKSS